MYVDKMVRKYGQKPPVVTDEKLDTPVQELTMTLDRWYETGRDANNISLNLHRTLKQRLAKIVPYSAGAAGGGCPSG